MLAVPRYLATGSEDKAAYVYDERRAGAEDAVWKCRGARDGRLRGRLRRCTRSSRRRASTVLAVLLGVCVFLVYVVGGTHLSWSCYVWCRTSVFLELP